MDKSWNPPQPPSAEQTLSSPIANFHIVKMGPLLTESDVKLELKQFGDIVSIQESRDSTQNFLVELRFGPSKSSEHVLAHINNNFKQNGWSISEVSRHSGHDQQLQRSQYPQNQMNHHMGHNNDGQRVPYYYHMPNPQQRPPYSYNMGGGYGMPGPTGPNMNYQQNMRMMHPGGLRPPPPPPMGGGQMSHMYHNQPSNHGHGSNYYNSAPQVISSGSVPNLIPQKPPEDKIDITSDIMANLRALKNPDKMMDLLRLDSEVVQKLVLGLTNNYKLSLVVHNIKVREIWVGNLTEDTTKTQIEDAFTKYGDIENIEIFNKPNQIFAFLKYKKVKQAAAAFENIDNLSVAMKLSLKISYSDFSKRNSVVGDNAFLEDNEEDLTPYLFMAYNSGLNLPRAKRLQKKMSEFGIVKGILLKPSYDSNYKSFVIVEFEAVDQAVKARKYYFVADKSSKRRQKLGAKDIDINILTKVPEMRKFELTSQMVKSSTSSNKISSSANLRGKPIAEGVKEIFKIEEDPKKVAKDAQLDKSKIEDEKPIIEVVPELVFLENELLTEKYELCWSGTVYKGKTQHFLCDILFVEGEADPLKNLAERLIITHKTSVRDALSRKRIATALINPSNQASYKEYMDNLSQFKQEDIVGVTLDPPKSKVFGTVSASRQSVVYIIPYSDKVKEYFPRDADARTFLVLLADKGDLDLDVLYSKISTEENAPNAIDDVKDKVIIRHDEKNTEESVEDSSSESLQDDDEIYSNQDNQSNADSNNPGSPVAAD
jgi:RNA recognition motif-containing protein